jgi:hypothetical protein
MGQHDRDNTKDGYWPKQPPKDDMRDVLKDDHGKHSADKPEQDDEDQDKK